MKKLYRISESDVVATLLARPPDFESDEHYEAWLKGERKDVEPQNILNTNAVPIAFESDEQYEAWLTQAPK